jgi:hypothetical protein
MANLENRHLPMDYFGASVRKTGLNDSEWFAETLAGLKSAGI